jgi:hypothetical protein
MEHMRSKHLIEEQIARYRSMLWVVSDKITAAALKATIAELEAEVARFDDTPPAGEPADELAKSTAREKNPDSSGGGA